MDAEREQLERQREAAIAFQEVTGRPLTLEEFACWFAIVAESIKKPENAEQRDQRDELGAAFEEWRDRVELSWSTPTWFDRHEPRRPLIFSSYGNLVSRLRKLLKRISKRRHGPEWEMPRPDVEEAVTPSTRVLRALGQHVAI
jgi:hypothetical protein